MERFIRIKEEVSLQALSKILRDNRIIILRKSQTTDTVQIKILEKLSSRTIREAFRPYTVEKIYSEFPFPLKSGSIFQTTLSELKKMMHFQS
ncbi:hypothetical protein JXB12_09930 [candidate division KSB1 bacterium]|nr:hypothetical protein [candidate division KSB1 bacterium]